MSRVLIGSRPQVAFGEIAGNVRRRWIKLVLMWRSQKKKKTDTRNSNRKLKRIGRLSGNQLVKHAITDNHSSKIAMNLISLTLKWLIYDRNSKKSIAKVNRERG